MYVKKAVIPIAGLGTRMLPATKSIPKEMLPLVDKPLIHYIVEEVVAAGINQIIFVTGRTKKAVEDYFDKNIELELSLKNSRKEELLQDIKKISNMCDIVFIRQKEQKGLGHAVYCAKDVLGDNPFVVVLPDDIIMYKKSVVTQLIEQYEVVKSPVIALQKVSLEESSKYGIVDIESCVNDKLYKLKGMVEKPEYDPPSSFAIIGRYLLTADVLNNIEYLPEGALGEIQLTDALREVAKNNNMYGYIFDGLRFDCGKKLGYLEAVVNFALNRDDLKDDLLSIIASLTV